MPYVVAVLRTLEIVSIYSFSIIGKAIFVESGGGLPDGDSTGAVSGMIARAVV